MKILIAFALTLLTLSQNSLQAAQTAAMRLYCLSIRFGHASFGGPNALYSLDLTGIQNGINGELYPVDDSSGSHFSSLVFYDEISEQEFAGYMYLDVPATDNNGDGFPDIFDTSLAFNGSSFGTYNDTGNVTATWSRDAGSQDGLCKLEFEDFGEPFYHTFTILEYKGPVTYTPGTNVVAAKVNLTMTGFPDSKLEGPLTFTKTTADPYNDLDFDEGVWTNTIPDPPQTFPFVNGFLGRDSAWPTNYFSYYYYFEFEDGDLNTEERDYFDWQLSIDDVNDADSDGIPDFSDDPQIISARAPLLSLNRGSGNLLLTISGEVGQICEIQEASTVDAMTWATISSVTLTNDPQTVSLPLPETAMRFWRVHTP